jgi:hypothetical protein
MATIISYMAVGETTFAPNQVVFAPHDGNNPPSWSSKAAQLRVSGGYLDGILRGYSVDPTAPIVGIGFSAGSNNGLRELVRDVVDRERIAGVIALDGLHWNVWDRALRSPTNFKDWKREVAPFAHYAEMAANGVGWMVVTASSVASPGPSLTSTSEALDFLADWVGAEEVEPTITPSILPIKQRQVGQFVAQWYPGVTGDMHRYQGGEVRDVVGSFVLTKVGMA